MWQVVKKLKMMKRGLKQLNSQYFRNIVTEADEDRQKLKKAQEKLQGSPVNTTTGERGIQEV